MTRTFNTDCTTLPPLALLPVHEAKVDHLRSIYRMGFDPAYGTWQGLGVLRQKVRELVVYGKGLVQEIAMALIKAQRALDRSHHVRTVRGLQRAQRERAKHLGRVQYLLSRVVWS